MRHFLFATLWLTCMFFSTANAEHLILTGGPALRSQENLRVEHFRHDRWWANFVRASTLRIDEIRGIYGPDAPITWIVYRPGYELRGSEEGKPYTSWINEISAKRNLRLIWISTGSQAINAINQSPRGKIITFDYFGHSNRHCFLLDYSTEIIGSSGAWIHENDLSRLRSSAFQKNAQCQSWGCHTAESMSAYWKSATGLTLIGCTGKTDYSAVGSGKLPFNSSGRWVR